MFGKKNNEEVINQNQKEYREFFDIEDKVLIYYEKNDAKSEGEKDGYIVFINKQNDLDYVDYVGEYVSWQANFLTFNSIRGYRYISRSTSCT